MTTKKYISLSVFALFSIVGLSACISQQEKVVINKPTLFKVIAYVTDKKMEDAFFDDQLSRVTHINYSFINPDDDASGKIANFNRSHFEYVVEKVKRANKSLFISLGGWRGDDGGYDLVYEKIAADPQAKKAFIDNIMALVNQYNLDGVDLDWEYPRVVFAEQYADFVIALAQALHASDKYLTAAVIGTKEKPTDDGDGAAYLDRALAAIDWINLMAYDATSTDHSPYDVALQSIDYWLNQRAIPAEKMVLGLPLYARPSWRSYHDVIKNNKAFACQDAAVFENKSDYYNGIPTILKKTQLAMNTKLAGVMVWELAHDSSQVEYSLMQTIHASVNQSSQDNDPSNTLACR